MATQTTTIKVVADTRDAERALGRLNGALATLVTAGALAGFARFSDSMTNIQNKLALVTQEGQNAADMFGIVAKSAIQLGVPMKDVGDLFFRVANNTKDLGLRQTEQVKITETLIKGFQLTGATAGEVAGGVVQLGQAFAVGVLRGDELNSVLESLPLVAQALADKFGVQTGALKALGEQGRITSRDLADAILTSGQAIDTAFGNKLPTITEQFNRLQTALGVAFTQANNGVNISEALGTALLKITIALVKVIKFFEDWGETIKIVLSILASLAAFSIVGRVLATIGAGIAGVIRAFGQFGSFTKDLMDRLNNAYHAINVLGKGIGTLAPVTIFVLKPIGRLIGAIGALTAAVLTFIGVKDLFPKDKQDAIKTQKDLVDELNKSLGLDQKKALDQAREAQDRLTAQQLKDADAVRKANINRNESLRAILNNQRIGAGLTQFESSELKVQEAILQANSQLVQAIRNDKGEIIGYTKGLTEEEAKQVRMGVEQNILGSTLRDLRQQSRQIQAEILRLDIQDADEREIMAAIDAKRLELGHLFTKEVEEQTRLNATNLQVLKAMQATEEYSLLLAKQRRLETGAQTIRTATSAISEYDPRLKLEQDYNTKLFALEQMAMVERIKLQSGLPNNLDTVLAAMSNLESQYRNAKEIADIEFNNRELNRAVDHQDALYNLTKKRIENEQLLRVQQDTGTRFSYEQQKQIAAEAAKFQMQTDFEKAKFGIDQAQTVFASLGAQNKKAFEASKALAVASAVMNTYQGATKALATYPWPFGLIAAAAAVAAGFAQVNAIKSQQYSGKMVGGAVAGAGSYIVGEKGPELFTPGVTGNITPNHQLNSGSTNVNFTIVANDTAGFDELLTSRRGVITQIISDAMLERGQRM